jgi:alkylmercury lyase
MDINALAHRIEGRFPQHGERGRRVALAVHRTLALGEPVPDYAIAAATGLEIREVRAEMDGWPGVVRNESGRITGFWGLSLGETAHQFIVEGRRLYTWCAWDTLFLPGLLGKDAEVVSRSGASGTPVRLRVTAAGARPSEGEVYLSFVDPELCDVAGDRVISTFCCHILFFASRGEGEAWVAERGEDTFLMTLDEAFELGRACNALRYGDALRGE